MRDNRDMSQLSSYIDGRRDPSRLLRSGAVDFVTRR
jgi:hypothetical protein